MYPNVEMERFHKYRGPILGITMDCGHEFVLTEPMTKWLRNRLDWQLQDDDMSDSRQYFPGAKPGAYCVIYFQHIVAGNGRIVIETKPKGLGGHVVRHEILFYYRALFDLIHSPTQAVLDSYYNGRPVGKGKPAKRQKRVPSNLVTLDPQSRR